MTKRTKKTSALAAAFFLLAGLLTGWGPNLNDATEESENPPRQGKRTRRRAIGTGQSGPVVGILEAAERPPKRVEGSWFVGLRDDLDPSEVAEDVARDHGGAAAHIYEHALHGFNYRGTDQEVASLRADPRVQGVAADYEVYATDDITKDVKRIRASHTNAAISNAYDAGSRGAGVNIGILDTGIDLDHPDLAANISDPSRWKNCRGTGPPNDGGGHGTATAGNAAADDNAIGVRGSAPDATLIPIKVLSNSGGGTFSDVACGVDHLTALALANPDERFVGNMSLAGSGGSTNCSDTAFHQAVCDSVAAGVVYTVAAGNTGGSASKLQPASFPEVITVSALDDDDGEPGSDDRLANFSSRGPAVDVMAPGVDVLSPTAGGGYSTRSGTSRSAPFAAGVAALVLEIDDGLSPAEVADLLKATGECPNGSFNLGPGNCPSGQWVNDTDGRAEPLVRAFEAASAADPGQPRVSWLQPASGAVLVGNNVAVEFEVTDSTDAGVEETTVASVELSVDDTAVATWATSITEPFEFTLDSSEFPDGPHSLVVHVVDNDGKTRTSTLPVTVSNAPPPLVEDFEDSSGWTFGGLWHVVEAGSGTDDDCVEPPYTSYRRSLYYGRDDTCTYNTGGSNGGTATSPPITGVAPQAQLTFSSLRIVQSARRHFDAARVEVSYDGGASWSQVWMKSARHGNDPNWTTESVALSPPSDSLRLRFRFSANRKANNFLGWFVDDVVLSNGSTSVAGGGGAGAWNAPPEIAWEEPVNGSTVWGATIPIAFSGDDEDAAGSLTSEWFIDGVSQGSAAYDDVDGRYEDEWDPSGFSDGWYTLEARLTDSGGASSRAFIDVNLDNVNDPPEASWFSPTDGGRAPKGLVPLRIAATDDRDAPADIAVEWRVASGPSGSTPFASATHAGTTGYHEATWDTSALEPGTYTLEAKATDAEALTGAVSQVSVEVVDAALFQDFEGALTGWTMSGLWSLEQDLACADPPYASPSHAAYYGKPATCNYKTGSRNAGQLTSPNVSVGSSATLVFEHLRRVEQNSNFRDVTYVDGSYDGGGSWQRLWQLSSRDPNSAGWQTETIALEPTAGTVRVRFGFDTMNRRNNGFLGWLVDDVIIVDGG